MSALWGKMKVTAHTPQGSSLSTAYQRKQHKYTHANSPVCSRIYEQKTPGYVILWKP